MKLFTSVVVAASILGIATFAKAADLSYNAYIITISGPIIVGDLGRFKSFLGAHIETEVVIVGESPGGILIEAMAIGEAINRAGLKTIVAGRCYSACALIAMSGVKKGLNESAVLAFHSPKNAGTGKLSTAGAALSGAYLHGLGIGYDFIYAAHSTEGKMLVIKPSDIDFLADEWGVYFFPVTTEAEVEFFLK